MDTCKWSGRRLRGKVSQVRTIIVRDESKHVRCRVEQYNVLATRNGLQKGGLYERLRPLTWSQYRSFSGIFCKYRTGQRRFKRRAALPSLGLTRVVASLAIPPGWLRKASFGWSPKRLNGSGIFWGNFVNIFRPSIWVTQGRTGKPKKERKEERMGYARKR